MQIPLSQFILPVILLTAFVAPSATASTISFTGNLRTDANVTACGPGCTLGPSNTDGDYAQYAAVVDKFSVVSTTSVYAITFSYGGGINGAGTAIPQGGLEPYLSLFDSGGNFLESTFFGTTCPFGAHTNTVSGQCYDVELDPITLGPGSYSIALSAFENLSFAENLGTGKLADGFTGLGNLAAGENLKLRLRRCPGQLRPCTHARTLHLCPLRLRPVSCRFAPPQRQINHTLQPQRRGSRAINLRIIHPASEDLKHSRLFCVGR